MNHLTTAVCTLGSLVSLTAFGVNFPHLNGNYDLTDQDAWGDAVTWPYSGTVHLAGTDAATATKDWTFGGIWPKVTGAVVDLTEQPGVTITLNGSNVMYPGMAGATIEFRGGSYNLSGVQSQMGALNSTQWKLSEGVVVTNVGNVSLRDSGMTAKRAGLVLTGAAKLYSTGGLTCGYKGVNDYVIGGDSGAEGVCLILEGQSQAFLKTASFGGGAAILRDVGSQLTLSGNSSLSGNGILEVTGARFETKDLTIGGAAVDSAVVYLDAGAVGAFTNVTLGSTSANTGRGHRFHVGSDASATVRTALTLTGTNQTVEVSNGALAVRTLSIGEWTDHGHVVAFSGAGTTFALAGNQNYLFRAGFEHRFSVTEGAKINWPRAFWFNDQTAATNTIEVSGTGSELTVAGSVYGDGGYQNSAKVNGARGYCIRVADGGKFSCSGTFYFEGSGNSISVSNATFEAQCAVESQYAMLGKPDNETPARFQSENNVIFLEGTNPLVKVGKTLHLKNSSRVVWRLPKEGYQQNHKTIYTEGVSIDSNTEFLFEGLDELQANQEARRAQYVLWEVGKGYLPTTGDYLTRANAFLEPKACSLSVTPDAKKLVLSVKSTKQRGMLMILR